MSELTDRPPTDAHKAFAAYIKNTHGTKVSAATVALVQRAYPEYLKSPELVAARAQKAAQRESEREAKAAAKAERMQARLDRLDAERAALMNRLQRRTAPIAEAEVDGESEADADVAIAAATEDDSFPVTTDEGYSDYSDF